MRHIEKTRLTGTRGGWQKQRRRNGAQLTHRRTPIFERLEDRWLLNGTTIITHGWDSGVDKWVDDMANAIQFQVPDVPGQDPPHLTAEYTLEILGTSPGNITGHRLSPDHLIPTRSGEAVILIDWSAIDTQQESTLHVGHYVANLLFEWESDLHFLSGPVHLIGHSRGASVNTTIAQRLAEAEVWIDQFTTLDPHPVDGIRDPSIEFGEVGCTEDPCDFGDTPISLWDNVRFADNYWRTEGDDAKVDFTGEPVPGAFDVNLVEDTLESGGYPYFEHADVHLWYRGTIDTTTYSITDGHATRFEGAGWYVGDMGPRDHIGYYYSQVAGGDRTGGAGTGLANSNNRTFVPKSNTHWPNLEAPLVYSGNSTVTQGASVPLVHRYQSTAPCTVTFGYDSDRNPFNGANDVLTVNKAATSTGSDFDPGLVQIDNLDTASVPPGAHYLYAKITNAGHTRYAYTRDQITVTPVHPDLIAHNVTVDNETSLTVAPGQQVRVDFDITNIGTGSAGSSLSGILWSTTDGISTSDDQIGTEPTGSINADGTDSEYKYVEIPSDATPGHTYYIGVIADVNDEVPNELSESNNDSDDHDSYKAVTVTIAVPEMEVRGNGQAISDGDETPSLSDHTSFGSVDVSSGSGQRSFAIRNTGTEKLNLTGNPKVQLSGSNASDFAVTQQPTSPVSANGGTTTFVVTFDPSGMGVRQATISIANDDSSENPYDFKIQGTGIDTVPPTPNPSTWSTEPYAAGTSSIRMVATTASDPEGNGVEYYFDCTTSGCHDSDWQASSEYVDYGLSPNVTYAYQVKTRDRSPNQNEGGYSSTRSATTDADTPPSKVPRLIADLNVGPDGSYPAEFVESGGIAFFAANGTQLWKTDGTTGGTVLVKDTGLGFGQTNFYLHDHNGTLVFARNDTGADGLPGRGGDDRVQFWRSDGTASGTAVIKDFGSGSSVRMSLDAQFTTLGDALFAVVDGADGGGNELWKTDLTESGTVRVRDINPGSAGSGPGELINVNGTLFFVADDGTHGRELWKSDGTEAGTTLVEDISPGLESSRIHPLQDMNGTLYFAADDGVHGDELWKSDGTDVGTVLVKDIRPGSAASFQYGGSFENVNGTLYFIADDGRHGNELWKSDGTSVGTTLVKDIRLGSAGSLRYGGPLETMNGTLYFVADDGMYGGELWRSDGTAAGTTLVKDILPGSEGSWVYPLQNVDGTLYFAADDGIHGDEPWKSNGTDVGTMLVRDIRPGSAGSHLASLSLLDGKLFFMADDGIHGREPLVIQVPTTLTIDDVTSTETDSGTRNFIFTVTLSGPNMDGVSVDYATVDGTSG